VTKKNIFLLASAIRIDLFKDRAEIMQALNYELLCNFYIVYVVNKHAII